MSIDEQIREIALRTVLPEVEARLDEIVLLNTQTLYPTELREHIENKQLTVTAKR